MTESTDGNPRQKCLRPDCERPARFRGLCNSCYGAASHLVRTKRTTWEQLISDGKCLGGAGRKNTRGATAWLLTNKEQPK